MWDKIRNSVLGTALEVIIAFCQIWVVLKSGEFARYSIDRILNRSTTLLFRLFREKKKKIETKTFNLEGKGKLITTEFSTHFFFFKVETLSHLRTNKLRQYYDKCSDTYQFPGLFPKQKWSEVKSLCHVWLFATPWTVVYKAPLSTEFSMQECKSGLPFPSPGDLPNPGTRVLALQADALLSEPPGKPQT